MTLLDYAHPVGSVYISTAATDPADLFGGGTWERIKDVFLLAAGDTYAAGASGGEAAHTLTEMCIRDRAKGQFAFEYTAHYSMSAQDTVPFEIYIKAGTAEA